MSEVSNYKAHLMRRYKEQLQMIEKNIGEALETFKKAADNYTPLDEITIEDSRLKVFAVYSKEISDIYCKIQALEALKHYKD